MLDDSGYQKVLGGIVYDVCFKILAIGKNNDARIVRYWVVGDSCQSIVDRRDGCGFAIRKNEPRNLKTFRHAQERHVISVAANADEAITEIVWVFFPTLLSEVRQCLLFRISFEKHERSGK